MTNETRNCQNCKYQFTIEPEDFQFYAKIAVPPPSWCPPCRSMRRLAWREERTLYRGVCALCKKPTISIYAPGGPFTVYCRDCWKSDVWDPGTYGRDYDFSRPFFEQFRKLMEAVPQPALMGSLIENSEYSHACRSRKNCYFTFWCYLSENSQYSFALLFSRDSYDSYVTNNSDHAYETLHSNRLYRVRFAYFADECLDSSFLFDCVGCTDCFGCVNLRKRKYAVFNKRLSKEEYAAAMDYWDLGSYVRLQEAKQKFRELYLSMPHRYAHVVNSVNVSGDIIRNTKDCRVCFSALDGVENCAYLYFGAINLKDSYDVNAGGDLCELLYETVATTNSQNTFWSAGGRGMKNVRYGNFGSEASDLFGCVNIKKKQYYILNKQYTKEEYEALVPKIIEHMNAMPYVDARGRVYKYGEFFPPELSMFAYNESLAATWYPKMKDEVLREGWRWRDSSGRDYAVTRRPEDLPDHIRDVGDEILKETIGCAHQGTCDEQCATAFRLTPEELSFYRDMGVALPRLCPSCRHAERLAWRNRYDLWRRKCSCAGAKSGNDVYRNTVAHFHGQGSCSNEFETTFAPDRSEIVYCDECYKAELL